MTVHVLASVKGAPGVTTMACALASTWPDPDRSVVVECDASGFDLAARFSLTTRVGWTSLLAARRRGGSNITLAEHLQMIPGGPRVLVGTSDTAGLGADLALEFATSGFSDGPWDVLVDLGRLSCRAGEAAMSPWLEVADSVLLLLRADAASLIHLRGWVEAQPDLLREHTWAVVTGGFRRPLDEIEEFVGIPVLGHVPDDAAAARSFQGEPLAQRAAWSLLRARSGRNRTPLVRAASHMAARLASLGATGGDAEHEAATAAEPDCSTAAEPECATAAEPEDATAAEHEAATAAEPEADTGTDEPPWTREDRPAPGGPTELDLRTGPRSHDEEIAPDVGDAQRARLPRHAPGGGPRRSDQIPSASGRRLDLSTLRRRYPGPGGRRPPQPAASQLQEGGQVRRPT